ncbi:hypothetical protein [Phenylobacterium sp.]|uniref:hypothetical protein n=1 Tax=Phenylobacterium sp. TaxID=1871053 RepID=UPI00273131DD|nr:hypothetical protein [Phenylobacterium sp.]MDP1873207.1 hypothetical protein [Phenylobacterium sp.]
MTLEDRFCSAVRRAYDAAGVRLQDHHARSLASVYARWAQGADEDRVVARVERALAASLGVRA